MHSGWESRHGVRALRKRRRVDLGKGLGLPPVSGHCRVSVSARELNPWWCRTGARERGGVTNGCAEVGTASPLGPSWPRFPNLCVPVPNQASHHPPAMPATRGGGGSRQASQISVRGRCAAATPGHTPPQSASLVFQQSFQERPASMTNPPGAVTSRGNPGRRSASPVGQIGECSWGPACWSRPGPGSLTELSTERHRNREHPATAKRGGRMECEPREQKTSLLVTDHTRFFQIDRSRWLRSFLVIGHKRLAYRPIWSTGTPDHLGELCPSGWPTEDLGKIF